LVAAKLGHCAVEDRHNRGKKGLLLWLGGQRVILPGVHPTVTHSKFVWKLRNDHGYKDANMPYKDWRKKEPNWGRKKDACVAVWYGIPRQYGWSAHQCEAKYCFICEHRPR